MDDWNVETSQLTSSLTYLSHWFSSKADLLIEKLMDSVTYELAAYILFHYDSNVLYFAYKLSFLPSSKKFKAIFAKILHKKKSVK